MIKPVRSPCWIGLDLGTSGCRAMAVDPDGQPIAFAKSALPSLEAADGRTDHHASEQDPEDWWRAVVDVLSTLSRNLDRYHPQAICVDGTSATLLLCTPQGEPLTAALMYNDARALEEAQEIGKRAPPDSAALGPSASLAKLLYLRQRLRPKHPALALHQADWISGRLLGQFGDSDWNNALKLGYDPQRLSWPSWLLAMELAPVQLPRAHAPGTDLGAMNSAVAATTGLPTMVRIRAGTTDSTAATLAAGAREPGDAVTSLGSTLVLKLVADRPVSDATSGIYSHRIGRQWLVGGASNSGGAVLRQHFDDAELDRLSAQIDPDQATGLNYYPLPGRGERFPIADPGLAPRIAPRPADDRLFLAGLLEGIAEIERAGYQRLRELGGPAPVRVLSSGGGARNQAWTAIRSRVLGLTMQAAVHQEAAYGAALLARGDWDARGQSPRSATYQPQNKAD